MHRPHLITWTTHTAEATTLLEATRLQEALLYTTLHYTYMCNIVTEFYLYSIVYIYLINSRLDVTNSVRHHFRTATLSLTFKFFVLNLEIPWRVEYYFPVLLGKLSRMLLHLQCHILIFICMSVLQFSRNLCLQ